MKTLSHALVLILSIQMTVGNAFGQGEAIGTIEKFINSGKGRVTGKVLNRGSQSGDKSTKQPHEDDIYGEVNEEEDRIEKAVDAETYIHSTAQQVAWFDQQCTVHKSDGLHVEVDKAFVLRDKIPYSDMEIKNCAVEQEKITHMVSVAKSLAKHFNINTDTPTNKTYAECGFDGAECSLSGKKSIFDSSSPNYVPPGDKCSLGVQKKLTDEKCSFMDKVSGAGFLGCGEAFAKGVVTAFKEMVGGIGTGLKWLGTRLVMLPKNVLYDLPKAIGSGVYSLFSKEDKQSSNGIHYLSKMSKKQSEEADKDKPGWLAQVGSGAMTILKEFIYKGLYDRESKCLNCAEKGKLFCEVGGRIINDFVLFSAVLGGAVGEVSLLAQKLGPKFADITAHLSETLAKSAENGNKIAKAINATGKAAGRTVEMTKGWARAGKNFIRKVGGKFSPKAEAELAELSKEGGLADRIAHPVNEKEGKNTLASIFRDTGTKTAERWPKTVALAVPRGIGKVFKAFGKMDSWLFHQGADFTTRITGAAFDWDVTEARLALRTKYLHELDRPEVIIENSKTVPPAYLYEKSGTKADRLGQKVQEIISKDEEEEKIVAKLVKRDAGKDRLGRVKTEDYRVWEVPPSYLNDEKIAELNRAGIKVPTAPNAEGKYVLETPSSNFKKFFKGEFETKVDPKTDLPFSVKDKERYTVIVPQDAPPKTFKTKDLSRAVIEDYRKNGAIFTTAEHPIAIDPKRVLNPNKIDPNLISRSLDDPGKVVSKLGEDIFVYKPSELTPEKIKKLEKNGHVFLERGTDNKAATFRGMGDDFSKTNAAKIYAETDPEKKMSAQLTGIEHFEVDMVPKPENVAAAKKEIFNKYGRNASNASLQGIDEAYHPEATRSEVKGNQLHVDFGEGEKYEVPLTKNTVGHGPYQVDKYISEYPNGTKKTRIVVRSGAETGGSAIYDVTTARKPSILADVRKADNRLVTDAMGLTHNAKPISKEAMEDVLINLRKDPTLKEGKDFQMIRDEKTGEETLRVNMKEECGGGSIDCLIAK